MSEWQPIETIPETRPVLVLWDAGLTTQWSGEDLPPYSTHWAPLPTMPAPDPMTVVAWHPMETLPDRHPEWVVIRHANEGFRASTQTERQYDGNRVAWCPLAPLVDLIDKAGQ